MPRWHPISISGYHIREAGSTAQQELAFTLKDGFTYVEQAIERGLAVDDFAPRLSFFFNAHIDFFEEIAKYRAARRIWAREMRETYGARDPRSMTLRFHTQTAGVSLTAQQPLVNVVRTTIEALAGIMGGTQSLHTNSYDEALALPTEEAVRLALRTQQVIAHESGVPNTVDPLGGSYFVETLTDEIERAAYEYFARIDELGGMVEAIKQSFPQREIADASFRYQAEVDRRERIVVGVNEYRSDDDGSFRSCASTRRSSASRTARLGATRGRRDSARSRARARRAAQRRRRRREPDAALPHRRSGARLGGRDDRRAPGRSSAPTPRRRSSSAAPAYAPRGPAATRRSGPARRAVPARSRRGTSGRHAAGSPPRARARLRFRARAPRRAPSSVAFGRDKRRRTSGPPW